MDLWTIPGGGYEPGETFEETALREAEEEVGVVSQCCTWMFFRLYTRLWGP